MLRRTLTLVALATTTLATRGVAQCADGAPPPCRASVPSRSNPPLDAKTWIVAPFTNITRATDLDWLSDASVTLLATDMSRWSDLRVVDAERVTDLLRGTPEASRTRLGLEAGLDMAKRAGAGKLVMGEFLRTGARTTVTARVFDVRTGARLRQLSEPAVVADSIPGTYQRLASRVVDAPAPQGTTLTGVGTSSIEAMRAYTLGMQASTRWRQDSANFFFRRAVALDSTFALALLRLGPATYESAVRHSANLPERERILIALGAPNLTRAVRCSYADRLLARDSMDAEGWVARGMCLLPGTQQFPLGNLRTVIGADGHGTPDAPINAARAAFQRALTLQPIRNALVLLMNLTWGPGITVCSSARRPCPADSSYTAAGTFEADTFALHFERTDPGGWESPVMHRKSLAGRRAMQTRARDYIARWVSEYPENLGAHLYYGYYSGLLGDLDVASRELRIAQSAVYGRDSAATRANILGYRIPIELRRGHADSAAVLVDSANHANAEVDEVNFGRMDRVARRDTSRDWPAKEAAYLALAGIVSRDAERVVALTVDSAVRNSRLETVRLFGFHALRMRPASDTASPYPLLRFQAFLALGDAARARRALAEFDAWGANRAEDMWTGYELLAAESRLELGDTTAAWQRIEPFARRFPGYNLNEWPWAIGRTWLLYADLAAATGHTAEARFGYRMVIGMWAKADPVFQPIIVRALAALTKLGG